jgi:hypothetical protein
VTAARLVLGREQLNEDVLDGREQRHHAFRGACLRGDKMPALPGNLVADVKFPFDEVDVYPTKAERLRSSQAALGEQSDDRPVCQGA